VIANETEYRQALDELRDMEDFLAEVDAQQPPPPLVGYTKAGIRKMIARLNEELGEWEAGAGRRATTEAT